MRFLPIVSGVEVSGAAGNEEPVELLHIGRATLLSRDRREKHWQPAGGQECLNVIIIE
jgi:hypothetical protein